MSLGPEGDALLAAINASMGVKINNVSTQVSQVAARVDIDERTVNAVNRTVESQPAQLNQFDPRIGALEKRNSQAF